MNATIEKIVGLLFEDIEETEEVCAIHEEVLTNCQERYEDLRQGGLSEDEAIHAVVESLSGMEETLRAYPRKKTAPVQNAPDHAQECCWTFDPAQSPIDTLRMQHMGSVDVSVEASEDELVHVENSDPDLTLLVSLDNGALCIGLTNAKPHIRVNFDLDMDWGDLFNRLSRKFAAAFSSTAQVSVRLPASLCPALTIETSSGDTKVAGVALESLTVTSGSGDFSLNGLSVQGKLQLTTASGDVNVLAANADQMAVSSTSGDLRFDRVEARSQARLISTSGDADWIGAAPELTAITVSGDVNLIATSAAISYKTISGDVRVQAGGSGLTRLQGVTTSGDQQVLLPADTAARISCHTRSGDVRLQRASIPDAALEVELTATSGDISVR